MNKHPSPEQLHESTPDPQGIYQPAPKKRAKTTKPAKRTCIMVLGMHRSGTSALTRAISLLGAKLPNDLLGANSTNPTGHWEPLKLIALHDQMLAEAGSRWDDWRSFDLGDLSKARAQFYRGEIARLIDEEYGDAPLLVLKEPRISRFVPLYASIFKSMNIDLQYVLASRNPLAVVASLGKRDRSTPGFGALLWLRHELEAERSTRGAPRVFVSYEAMMRSWRPTLDKITAALSVAWPRAIEKAASEVDAYISSDHQHHTASDGALFADERIAGWVKDTYSALRHLETDANGAEAMAILDRVKAEFDSVAPIFGEAFFPELQARQQILSETIGILQRAVEEHATNASQLAGQLQQKDADIAGYHQSVAEERAAAAKLIERNREENQKLGSELLVALDDNVRLKEILEKTQLELTEEKERSSAASEEVLEHHPTEVSADAGADSASFLALSRMPDEQEEVSICTDDTKLIAFYLPQFHRIDENSEWWGPGFTEWTNVARATPNFYGHDQPRIPRELGYYDLSHLDTMREQVEFAKLYGLHAFCFYHYWFSGRRVLEKPVDLFLEFDIDFKFCLCWANENWTRAWDGDTRNILLEQKYAEEDAKAFIETMIGYFKDERYIKIGGMPLLVVYRAKDIPDPRRWFSIWRDHAVANGFPGIHISVVDFYDISTPQEVGADSLVEFPPHKFNGPQNHPSEFPLFTNPNFSGGVVDYRKIIAQSANRPKPSFNIFRGIIPGWDNTARRQNNPTIVLNSTPELYGEWLRFLRFQARQNHPDPESRIVFINAWNEWGEGCYLEPDRRWGLSYLEETLRGKFFDVAREPEGMQAARSRLFDQLVSAKHQPILGAPISKETLAAIAPPSRMAVNASKLLRRWPPLHSVASFLYKHVLLTRQIDNG
ncbi:glycoside hydrolase family 99-like domain-containing protein [Mesorhizobium sp. W016]